MSNLCIPGNAALGASRLLMTRHRTVAAAIDPPVCRGFSLERRYRCSTSTLVAATAAADDVMETAGDAGDDMPFDDDVMELDCGAALEKLLASSCRAA